jgi:hypothetical protein
MSLLRHGVTILSVLVTLSSAATFAFAAQPTLESAAGKADLALCRGGRGSASINDRVRLLTESIDEQNQLLPGLTEGQRQHVSDEIAQLKDYKKRSETDRWFWDAGTTCPRQLDFPNKVINSGSAGGIQEAKERALRYRDIAICARGQKGYSISDRQGFLVSSIAILEQLKAVGIESIKR